MWSATRWMAGFALMAALFAAGGTSPVSAAEIKSGSWSGSDVVKDGVFRGCQINSKFQPNQILGFGIFVPGVFQIRMTNGAWAMEPGKVPISLWVDSSEKVTGTGVAAAKDTIIIPIPKGGPEFADALKKGNVLHLTLPQGPYDFKLSGTFKALGDLEGCWKEGVEKLRAAGLVNPAAPAAKEVKGADLLALSHRDFALLVLGSKRDGYFKVDQQDPEKLKQLGAALMWSVDRGFGFVTGVDRDADLAKLKDVLVNQRKSRCKGEVTGQGDQRTLPGTAVQVKRVEIRCSKFESDKPVVEVFSFYPQLSGTLYAVAHVASDRAVATAADDEFAKRVTAILQAK